MATNRTFTMVKPTAMRKGYMAAIMNQITEGGFKIVAAKMTQLSIEDAKEFYAIHSERPFFGELVEFMTRGPIVAAILEKDNAVDDFRALIGATNPEEAAEDLSVVVGGWRLGDDVGHAGPGPVLLPDVVDPLQDVRDPADLALAVGQLQFGESHQHAGEEEVAHRGDGVVEAQRGGDGRRGIRRGGRHLG